MAWERVAQKGPIESQSISTARQCDWHGLYQQHRARSNTERYEQADSRFGDTSDSRYRSLKLQLEDAGCSAYRSSADGPYMPGTATSFIRR